jgi:hypothetical protein
MTEIIITAPIAIRHPSMLRLQLPKLHIGRAISEISSAIVHAFEMAYVAPFSAMQPKHPIALDADLEGRDPNW